MEIKNSCYLPFKTIGIYQNDSLVISLNKNSLHFKNDGHWNENGHLWALNSIFKKYE